MELRTLNSAGILEITIFVKPGQTDEVKIGPEKLRGDLSLPESLGCVHTRAHACVPSYVCSAFKRKLKIPCRSQGLILLADPFLYPLLGQICGKLSCQFDLVVRSLFPCPVFFLPTYECILSRT